MCFHLRLNPSLDFRAFLPDRVRSATFPCGNAAPYPSMGFAPLQDPFFSLVARWPGARCKGAIAQFRRPRPLSSCLDERSAWCALPFIPTHPSLRAPFRRRHFACRSAFAAGFRMRFPIASTRESKYWFFACFHRNVTCRESIRMGGCGITGSRSKLRGPPGSRFHRTFTARKREV